ncbi:MAG: hypothetical protein AAFQ82_19040 [Myxococcota bacterium]
MDREPETPGELMDEVWKDSVGAFGQRFNTRAFWVPGLIAGLSGLGLCVALVPGEPPLRLVAGLVAFLILWLGVGLVGSAVSQRKR